MYTSPWHPEGSGGFPCKAVTVTEYISQKKDRMSRPYVELYIDRQAVEFTEPPQIHITYAHEDLHDPTVVKNSFSKTVTVDGTPTNNRIFGCFFNHTRVTAGGVSMTGADFNPSRKVPFSLYRNGECLETGYAKLDSVKRKGKRVQYQVTLYGGLGHFLYNLSYREDGEEMKLRDLEFPYDLDMVVNKNTVWDAWNHIDGVRPADPLYEFINFAPCYNGIPDDFSADRVAINVENLPDDFKEGLTLSKDGYGTYNGWIMGELNQDMDEWQMKDLRSYLQRPVIRFKNIVQACCDPKNNGGYQVVLDEGFFNSRNPYWEQAWMTLPLLTEVEEVEPVFSDEYSASMSDGKILLTGLEAGQNISLTVPVAVGATVGSDEDTLYTNTRYWVDTGDSDSALMEYSTNFTRYVQLVAYTADGEPVAGSSVKSFYTTGWDNNFAYSLDYKTSVERVTGGYMANPDGTYRFRNEVFRFDMTVEWQDGMYFKLVEKFAGDCGGHAGMPEMDVLFNAGGTRYEVSSYHLDTFLDDIEVKHHKGMGWFTTKDTLLNSENTPAKYFLDYIKMFNLHIWKEGDADVIHVQTRGNYFTGEEYDLEDYVDRGDDVDITPLTYDVKWYNFSQDLGDSMLAKDYADNHGLDYGMKKVDTNYNFDNSSKDLFKESVFQGAVMNRGMSKYYVDIYQDSYSETRPMPAFLQAGVQTLLVNGEGETTDGDVITPNLGYDAVPWFTEKYRDVMPKPSFVGKKNDGADGANVLLFFDGKREMKDTEDKYIWFTLTDDIPEFERLNESEPCWIYTSSPWDANGNTVALNVSHMPNFSRYITNSNGWVTHSWDFGTPLSLYVPDYKIDDSSSVYTQYWQPYIRDRYDVNTRVVECKVYLRERVLGDWLRRFYFWDGSWWMLNRITDYDPTYNGTTKCEFVRINDKNNYR